MSLFWILFLVIFTSGLFEFFFQKQDQIGRTLLIVNVVLITLMLCFRYGEGSDYPSYEYLYGGLSNESWQGFWHYKTSTSLMEIGYYFFAWIFASNGVPFAFFAALIAVIEAPLLFRFLDRYCKGSRCMALMILYPLYTFIYQLSGLRQGLTIALFLGLMFPLFEKKKWGAYLLLAIVCFLFHKVAILFFLLPLTYLLKTRLVEILMWISVAGGILYNIYLYASDGRLGLSVSAFAVRIALWIVMAWIIRHISATETETVIYRILCLDLAGYALLSWDFVVASRFYDEVRFLDIILVVSFLRTAGRKLAFILQMIIVLLAGAMLAKNLTVRARSGMIESVNAFNYPYFTIFHKERLYDYYIGDWTPVR